MDSEVKDFTNTTGPVQFRINDDVFEAPSVLPVPVMKKLAGTVGALKAHGNDIEALDSIVDIFDIILVDDSALTLRGRIESKTNPVGISQLIDIMMWLLEKYGLRPTVLSSDSSALSEPVTTGMPLTDGALNAV